MEGESHDHTMDALSLGIGGGDGEEVSRDPQWHLSQPDSILEPGVMELTRAFISGGGTPQAVVQMLSESFVGFAQLANLVARWLVQGGLANASEVDRLVKESLTELIVAEFDPDKADTIFSVTRSAPKWLDQMIQEPEWRGLVYRLSESYPNCLMLSFAIQRISEAGHQTEIASLTTASNDFDVFNRVLSHSLETLARLNMPDMIASISDLAKLCNHSQHTYLYAQYLITQLAQSGENYHGYWRVSQELERLAREEHGEAPRRVGFLLSGLAGHSVVADALGTMLSTGKTNPGDILKLYTLYSSEKPPPASLICEPCFLQLLISDCFTPHGRISSSHNNKYLFVLAYATSVNERSGHVDRTTPSEDELRTRARKLVPSLKEVQRVCQNNYLGKELKRATETLLKHIQFPVVAMAVIHWVHFNLTRSEFCHNPLCTPVHLDLLKEICLRHGILLPKVVETVVASFDFEPDLDATSAMSMRRDLLNMLVYTMCCGYVIPVVDIVRKRASHMDQSLIRYFLVQLLGVAQQPYTDQFIVHVLKLFSTLDLHVFQRAYGEDVPDEITSFIKHIAGTRVVENSGHVELVESLMGTFGSSGTTSITIRLGGSVNATQVGE